MPTQPKPTSLDSSTDRPGGIADQNNTGAAAPTAEGSGPHILRSTDKGGSALPLLGVEGHLYEVHHDCLLTPSHIPWMATHDMVYDRSGLLYLIHQTETPEPVDAIVVFDQDLRCVRSFGKEFHGGGHGLQIRDEGGEEFLYVADVKGHIGKLSLRGEVVWIKSAPTELEPYRNAEPIPYQAVPTERKGKGFAPTAICFASDGGFFVSDGYGSDYVIRYDEHANPVGLSGGLGEQIGRFSTPHGVSRDDRPGREPSIVVCDRANSRLQYFTEAGQPSGVVEGVLSPCQVVTHGEVMAIADLQSRITLMDRDNQVIAHLGDDASWREEANEGYKIRKEPQKWRSGRFVHPHGLCFDTRGNFFVAEWVCCGRVSFLKHVG